MKNPSLRNQLWVVQYRRKARPHCKPQPWRLLTNITDTGSLRPRAYYKREEARWVASCASVDKEFHNYEFRTRRYTDSGKG